MSDAKREAELAVIEELQRHRAGGGWAAGGELGKRLDELDRLSSPLPSREEMRTWAVDMGEAVGEEAPAMWQVEASGAFWLRWAADNPGLDYQALADKLENQDV